MKKLILIFTLMLLVIAGCGDNDSTDGGEGSGIDKIILADAGWDSIRFHNSIAQRIIEEGYGYETDVTSGSTAATIQGLRQGDIDAYMEVWTDNIKELYNESIDSGDILKLSTNFDDNKQGLWVPTYVIEGDEERGIEAKAPDLKSVKDLEKYPEVFKDPEDPGKGRVIGAPSGWALSEYLDTKMTTYGLEEEFNYFLPGSDSAIVTSLADAYKNGEPWVGYYWSPTWVTAKYDMTLLEEPEFDQEKWDEDKGTEFPPNDVVVAANKDLPDQAPEVVEFLENYETSSDLTGEALAYMKDNEASADEAAQWWMEQHEDIWTEWVPEDVATKVKDSME
ncbi:ABC transporter substrate-binding protein [Thalassobacillus hwangdonensis]|uniref:ABC transporter substrate-binding protein n=1 Tax=Thalassobacillus hwangdonensis TaxID=546108 RepID=A0ABW3L526_9BACI